MALPDKYFVFHPDTETYYAIATMENRLSIWIDLVRRLPENECKFYYSEISKDDYWRLKFSSITRFPKDITLMNTKLFDNL